MTDIVERLRDTNSGWCTDITLEAADMIETLCANNDTRQQEINRLIERNGELYVRLAAALANERQKCIEACMQGDYEYKTARECVEAIRALGVDANAADKPTGGAVSACRALNAVLAGTF